MARPPVSPAERARQRTSIRRAALEISAEAGIDGLTARAISERAGVSSGTLYRYFSSLEEIVQSLWAEPVERAGRRLEQLADKTPDPVERIRMLLSEYVDFSLENPEVFRRAMLFVRPDSMPEPTAAPADDLPFYRLLRDAVVDAQSDGSVVSGDADLHAQLLWASVHGALALPVNMHRFTVRPGTELARAMIDQAIERIAVAAP